MTLTIDRLKAKLETINKLKPDELIENLKALNVASDTARKVLPLLQDIKVEEKRMLELGLGENHSHIREDRVAEEQYNTILQREIEGIRRAQTEQLKEAEETLKTLSENVARSTGEARELQKKTHDYIDAKARYLEDKRILDATAKQYDAELLKAKDDSIRVNVWEADIPTVRQ